MLSRRVSSRLSAVASSYYHLGYSVIPLYGNLKEDQAKVAAVEWKTFQSMQPEPRHFKYWFDQKQYGGVAIVTGKVSSLVVLDFDNEDLLQKFLAQFPRLSMTRTVLSATRRLPHFYYRIPTNSTVKSRRIAGVDLLSDGCYVVAPPTQIGENEYVLKRGGAPILLSRKDITRINMFLDECTSINEVNLGNLSQETDLVESVSEYPLSRQDVIHLYQFSASKLGRNNALFQLSCKLRDHGWGQDDVRDVLIPLHIEQQSSKKHRHETHKSRQSEGIATIQSAFSRPMRKVHAVPSQKGVLANSLREYFLKRNQVAFLRVTEGLLLNGITGGTILTESQITQKLRNCVGRYSVLKALSTRYPDGTLIFQVADPSPRPPSHTTVATATAENTNNKCLLFSTTGSDKNQRGRPGTQYIVPDAMLICATLDLNISGSDPLTQEDLKSPAAYRSALYRELIKRRPGQYSGEWLGGRLGITKRQLQRYYTRTGIKRRASYTTRLITWETLNEIPEGFAIKGAFLKDESGKMYPPLQSIASRLLAKKQKVVYQRQMRNYYWHPATQDYRSDSVINSPESRINDEKYKKHALRGSIDAKCIKTPEKANPVGFVDSGWKQSPEFVVEPLPTCRIQQTVITPEKIKTFKQRPKRYYRKPLPDELDEMAAQRLYHRATGMSVATARKLVEQYGTRQVRKVSQTLSWRDNIENPAAFAVVWLRSEARKAELLALNQI